MQSLKILGTRAGREYGISKKNALDRLGLQSNVFALPCSMALTLQYGTHLHSGQAWPAEQCLCPDLQYGTLLHSGQAWPAEQCLCPALKYGTLLHSGQAWPAEQCLCPDLQYGHSPPLRTDLAWPSSPAVLGTLYSMRFLV